MNTDKKTITKPVSSDPVREALDHPSGPGLLEMLGGKEEEKLQPGKTVKKEREDPNIPII